jgi:hypothetical protein
MKNLKRLTIGFLLSIFLVGMSSCLTINTGTKSRKDHPVFKVHPKNNGKKKGHYKFKYDKKKHDEGKHDKGKKGKGHDKH